MAHSVIYDTPHHAAFINVHLCCSINKAETIKSKTVAVVQRKDEFLTRDVSHVTRMTTTPECVRRNKTASTRRTTMRLWPFRKPLSMLISIERAFPKFTPYLIDPLVCFSRIIVFPQEYKFAETGCESQHNEEVATECYLSCYTNWISVICLISCEVSCGFMRFQEDFSGLVECPKPHWKCRVAIYVFSVT